MTDEQTYALQQFPETLVVVRLPPGAEVPEWAESSSLFSITATATETSLVCASRSVPKKVVQAGPFRAFAVEGPLDFALTGVLVSLLVPLAEAGISIFTISTYDTDWVLVPVADVDAAAGAWHGRGHSVAPAVPVKPGEEGSTVSVTGPAGFRAAGVAAGLKSTGAPDVALVVNDGPSAASASVFTANRCKANPVLWSQEVVKDGVVRAVVLNSGGANCYTGAEGFQTTHAVAERVAAGLGIGALDVVVCSTGLIGLANPRDKVLAGVDGSLAALREDGGDDAAHAIMTTDSVSKQVLVHGDGWSVGGMAKGAGMLAPALATMLVVLTTDADVDATTCDMALRAATRATFDRLDSDGCMSTNDTVTLLASGASGAAPSVEAFTAAVTRACSELAMRLLADAEGADHEITITTVHAASEDDAVEVGRSVARSALFKAAVFGKDPNWGRVLASIGTTGAAFDPADLDVAMNDVWVCRSSTPAEDPAGVDLSGREVTVTIDLKAGDAEATVWTNDLTHAYVHENSAYSS